MIRMITFKMISTDVQIVRKIEMFGNTEPLKRGYSSIRDLVLFVNLEV